MNKILIFIFLLSMPFFSYAEEVCNQDDIKIESIVLDSIKGNAEEISSANNDNNKINLNTKMNVIDDEMIYKVIIKNTSDKEYTFDKNSLSTEYLNYDITYEDGSNIVKPNESKVIYLNIKYSNKPEADKLSNDMLRETNEISFNLIKEEETIIETIKEIANPVTKDGIIVCVVAITVSITLFLLLKKYKQTKYLVIILLMLIFIPRIKAICTCNVDINMTLEIDAKNAVFLTGQEVNVKMKELAGDDTSTSSQPHIFENENITSIKYSETEPEDSNKEENNIVSTSDSPYPIYMWFDNGTIYWWSIDSTPSLNENTSSMFYNLINLVDITGLEKLDSSNVNSLMDTFANANINSLLPLSKWNVSNVKYLFEAFSSFSRTSENLDGLENWDVSNVLIMAAAFPRNSLKDLSALRKWDVSKVIDFRHCFQRNSKLESLNGLEDWNIKSAQLLSGLFGSNNNLKDIIALKKWDTSKVEDMSGMFSHTSIDNLNSLEYWDTTNVTDMSYMFRNCEKINSLKGLENWDTTNVKNYNYMFCGNSQLNETNYINDWNIPSDASFDKMFKGTNTHPEFTKVPGTWNNGTFIPAE